MINSDPSNPKNVEVVCYSGEKLKIFVIDDQIIKWCMPKTHWRVSKNISELEGVSHSLLNIGLAVINCYTSVNVEERRQQHILVLKNLVGAGRVLRANTRLKT
uniref:Uncharacterized protein n=1 Tax=Marseillevirus LCMAC202 TaxID=2506606 RepID=A0A481YYI9_9VIRU|nr:MAG: hypothetical protein LCMAC202_06840 [Marseillevirus LCMAC202]